MNYKQLKWLKELDLSFYKLSLYAIYAIGLMSIVHQTYEFFGNNEFNIENYKLSNGFTYNKSTMGKAAEDLMGLHHYRDEHILELIHP